MRNTHYNILHVASLPVSLGARKHSGLGHVVWGLAKAQQHRSPLSVGIAARGAYFKRFASVDNVHIHGISFSTVALGRALGAAVRTWKDWLRLKGKDRLRFAYALYFMSSIFQRMDCDVLHVHHISNLIPLAARALSYDGPIVAHIHSYSHILNAEPARRDYFVQTANYVLSATNTVVHVSEHAKHQGLQLGVRHQHRGHIVHNGMKVDAFRANDGPRAYSVCFVGAFLPIKGIEMLIDALRVLVPFERPVCWVGEGPLESLILDRCATNEISVEMPGLVSNCRARGFMRSSSVLAVPSQSESFGQVYVESLLEGTPVVGYAGVIGELQSELDVPVDSHWLKGFDHDKDTSVELAASIQRAMQAEYDVIEHRRIHGAVQERFSWTSRVEAFEDIYANIEIGQTATGT